MPRVVGPVNPGVSIDINISSTAPEGDVGRALFLITYKLWWRDAANPAWTNGGEGTTGDTTPDFYQRAYSKGAQMYYWVGVASEKANEPYAGVIAFSQDGKGLPNGLILLSGKTNAKSVALHQDWVNFV